MMNNLYVNIQNRQIKQLKLFKIMDRYNNKYIILLIIIIIQKKYMKYPS